MRYLATKTLAAINTAIEKDQGGTFRQNLGKIIPHIGDAYRGQEPPRSHMGASGLGEECARKIWLNWRWATANFFDGRMLRLFNRGHLEEARFIAMLLTAGIQVYQQNDDGKQFRIHIAGGHAGGSGDGVGFGVPDLDPGTWCLLEFKTMAKKKFEELQLNGVQYAAPIYYVQAQLYMGEMGLNYCLHMTVCKDNDELYAEIIVFDRDCYLHYKERAERLVAVSKPPPKIRDDPKCFQCNWCQHKPLCHGAADPVRSCRSCTYAEAVPDGTWRCHGGKLPVAISITTQYTGCDKYVRGW